MHKSHVVKLTVQESQKPPILIQQQTSCTCWWFFFPEKWDEYLWRLARYVPNSSTSVIKNNIPTPPPDTCRCVSLSFSPAVDRSVTASLSDARDAMTNAAIDSLASYRQSVLTIQQPGLLSPACLRLFPLFILALLKQVNTLTSLLHSWNEHKKQSKDYSTVFSLRILCCKPLSPFLIDPVLCVCGLQKAFRTGTSTRLDDRVFAMCQLKYQPLAYSMLMIHPALYRIDDLTDEVRRRKFTLSAFTY